MEPDHSTKDLPDHIQLALARAVGASGRRLIAAAEPELHHEVELRYATDWNDAHRLSYDPRLERHREHLLLDAATKIKRVWESPSASRVVPDPSGYISESVANDLEKWATAHPGEARPSLVYKAVFDAVTRMPTDLRVARDITDFYPQQTEALASYTHDRMDWLAITDAWCQDLPESLNNPLKGMRAAYGLEMNSILGNDSFPVPESHTELGRTLADRLYIGVPQGHQGDVVATELWAGQLGLDQAYRWKRLDH